MAARHKLHALRNHPSLQRFLIGVARPTGQELGVGSYGSVEELEVSGVVCAGKKIHEALIEKGNIGTESIASRYVEECQLMSDLRHPHLVQFLGVCFLPNSTLPVLVMERLLTNLDELIEHNPDIPLSLKRSILADVARGLVYLHSHSPPVIHRDLSAKNVLLNSAMVAKIGDLGNARIVNFQPGQLARTLSRIPGTMVYMPPEAFEDTSKYGPSLDTFSFGHLSLFTITQVFPGTLLQHTYRDPENPRHRLARTEVQRRGEYIKLLHQQLGEQHPLVLLVKQCLEDEPSERPSAQELLQGLEGMGTQIRDPYQHLNKLEAMRMLRERDTQLKASSTSREELVALQKQMEQLQLEHSSQLTAKDSQLTKKDDEIIRLGEEMKTLKLEYVSQLLEKDSQLAEKNDENSKLMSIMKAVLEAREVRILQLVAETEQKEAVIHRLMAELRGLQPQQQKAPVTPPVLKARKDQIKELGAETERKEAKIHTELPPVRQDLPFRRKAVKDKRKRNASMTSAAASSVTHTRPGGDSPLEEEIYGFFHFPDHTCPKPSPSPKAVKKSATAVDMAKGLQNTAPVLKARKAQTEELGAETERKEAGIHTELPPVRQHYQRDAAELCCQPKHSTEKTSGNAGYTTLEQELKERGWAIPRRSVITKHLIGRGKLFKDVFLGEYQGQKVAMTMRKYTENEKASQQLLAEAAIMTALQHPNLVRLIGVCLDEPPVYLITEYMAKGSLLCHLRSQGRAEISELNQLDFARDICKGMAYMETRCFVHRNLAARNVLIGDDNTAKVSDFRLTREEPLETEDKIELMILWAAPEALKETKFSTKSDVWSFGILLWEIYSYGRNPYPHLPVEEVVNHVVRGYRMDAPDGCPDDIYQIMKECWGKDAGQRPQFTQIESMLESISVS